MSSWPPQPSIPRHRPGHLAKVDNLDVLLAQGQITDPLAGNTTLVTWDKIVVAWEDYDGSTMTAKTYDVDANLGNPIAKRKEPSYTEVEGTGSMDIASGYLGGTPGWIQTVAAWEHPQGRIAMSVQGYDADLNVGWTWPVDTGEQVD